MSTSPFKKTPMTAVLLLFGFCVLLGCSSGSSDQATSSGSATAASPAMMDAAKSAPNGSFQAEKSGKRTEASNAPQLANYAKPMSPQNTVVIPSRKVIRRAELDIRVENVEKAEKKVSGIIESVGGYTESANSTDLASTHPVMTISIRVPVDLFDGTISRLESLGVRLSKKISSEDVTGRIVDLDAQLKTLTAQAEVYRNMLRGRTQLDEVFNIQQQLANVQTQIEQITSQRKSQAGLAALSTIQLTLEQNAVISQPTGDPNWVAQSWAEATSGSSSVLRLASIFLMWVVAFSPFWIPVLLILRRLMKGIRTGIPARPTHQP